MKRLALLIGALAMMMLGFTTSATAATLTVNFANAPTGAHFASRTATPACTVSGLTVTCNSYEIVGVGNTNANASLTVNYTATVQCRNHGGQIVEVHSQAVSTTSTSGDIAPKNGRLLVPSLSSAPAPTAAQFEALATCPNPNWTPEVLASSIRLASFTYTLTFVGFNAPAITITGP
jgi:hypothetical protein